MIYFMHIETKCLNGLLTSSQVQFTGEHFEINNLICSNVLNLTYFDLFLRRSLPYFDKVCSAELLNHKVMIPCDPVQYLNTEYGRDTWIKPKPELDNKVLNRDNRKQNIPKFSTKYTWPNLHYYGKYDDGDLIKSARFFKNDGTIDYDITLRFIYNGLRIKKTKFLLQRMIANEPFKV